MPSIEQRSPTTYRITISTGYDTAGKKLRKHKTVTIPDTMTDRQREAELNRQAVLFEEQVRSGQYMDGEKITLGEFAQKWLSEYAEKQLAPRYRSRL